MECDGKCILHPDRTAILLSGCPLWHLLDNPNRLLVDGGIDSFGYLSLHYICSVPGFPYRFEIQMRTLLQHAWANMDHDTGYKSGVEIPKRYMRNMSRLAGMLELVDDEFSKIRIELTDYRRRVQALVRSGNLDEERILVCLTRILSHKVSEHDNITSRIRWYRPRSPYLLT